MGAHEASQQKRRLELAEISLFKPLRGGHLNDAWLGRKFGGP